MVKGELKKMRERAREREIEIDRERVCVGGRER